MLEEPDVTLPSRLWPDGTIAFLTKSEASTPAHLDLEIWSESERVFILKQALSLASVLVKTRGPFLGETLVLQRADESVGEEAAATAEWGS